MIQFLLNQQLITTDKPASTTLLDFIRYDENLKATKIGCREGDCGACTVLIGELQDGKMSYSSVTSCLTPLANAQGKHVVTVEGTNLPDKLNQAQQAMVDCSGTQCGFCTPGFVNSMSGYALTCDEPSLESAISAIDGNICRCTGYKSIERAVAKLTDKLQNKDTEAPLNWLVANDFIPDYFLKVPEKLAAIKTAFHTTGSFPIGGGTDIYVQKHDQVHAMDLEYLFDKKELKGIAFEGNKCTIAAATTVTDLIKNETLLNLIPNWHNYLKLLSSTPIRNIATVAGNIANGSPIGDFTIILLAMKAELILSNANEESRQLPLKDFYLGYKTFDKKADEIITKIIFEIPTDGAKFHFEKVSKRQYLDIASVNTACTVATHDNMITEAVLSMGGVGPIPTYLTKTSAFLSGKALNKAIVKEAEVILQSELAPISDARGAEAYKRLLARQLFFAHFITLFPETFKMDDLV
jgi:xanthine dehydrogenase small subunit